MWRHFFLFEIRYWLRSWMFWLCLVAIAVVSLYGVAASDLVFGTEIGDNLWNGGFTIEEYYQIFSWLTVLLAAIFAGASIGRDFKSGSDELVFSTPITKLDYLAGKFLGASLIAFLPMLGVSLGFFAAKYLPWVDKKDFGPVNWAAHGYGIALFALPDTLLAAAAIFAISALTRSRAMSILAPICVLSVSIVSHALASDLSFQHYGALIDPLGMCAFDLLTKYWTAADRANRLVGFHGVMLWNRLLCVGTSVLIAAFAYWRFRFAPRERKLKRRAEAESLPAAALTSRMPQERSSFFMQYLEILRFEFRSIVKTGSFLAILVWSVAVTAVLVSSKTTEGYGNTSFPVTYQLLETIGDFIRTLAVLVIGYFAGVVVWREKDTRVDELQDTLPLPEWLVYAAKLSAVLAVMLLFQWVALLSGVADQASHAYYRFQFGLYGVQLFAVDFVQIFLLTAIAFCCHVVATNRYAGYLLYTIPGAISAVFRFTLNETPFRLGGLPIGPYSDFFGWAPYRKGMLGFTLLWFSFCGVAAVFTLLFWRRGRDARLRIRLRNARLRPRGRLKWLGAASAIAFLGTAALLFGSLAHALGVSYFQKTSHPREPSGVRYEKRYKRHENLPQPRIVSLKYTIDLTPETRRAVIRCDGLIQNKTSQLIPELYLTGRGGSGSIEINTFGWAKPVPSEPEYDIYSLTPPLQPGETRHIEFIAKPYATMTPYEVGDLSFVQNGTFFNGSTLMPRIGYQRDRELEEDREKYGLGPRIELPLPEPDCTSQCRNNYIDNQSDWVDIETVISTSPDQIAIAPGSLVREWRANGRRYFNYKLDHSSPNFTAFLSATYQVSREQWHGISIEVYYLKEHAWNVPRMRNAIRTSLDYYTRNFGPYFHKEARVVEFPRVHDFAQSFPGTVPYSESVGFIADLRDPEKIDVVTDFVAHEMAHQWWAHQVIGADVQGSLLLSESLAEYSALMVMEKMYGQDMIRKLLRRELDRYLVGHGKNSDSEQPLMLLQQGDDYLAYSKASIVMYNLRVLLGEEAVNRALRRVLERYRYAPPPYPTSYALGDALAEETPDKFGNLLQDSFGDIVLFDNSTSAARARKRADGKYDVTVDVEAHKFKVTKGSEESEVPLNDWIEVGAIAKEKVLHRELVRMTSHKGSYKFTVDSIPESAGIDPMYLLVNKSPDNNLQPVSIDK